MKNLFKQGKSSLGRLCCVVKTLSKFNKRCKRLQAKEAGASLKLSVEIVKKCVECCQKQKPVGILEKTCS